MCVCMRARAIALNYMEPLIASRVPTTFPKLTNPTLLSAPHSLNPLCCTTLNPLHHRPRWRGS